MASGHKIKLIDYITCYLSTLLLVKLSKIKSMVIILMFAEAPKDFPNCDSHRHITVPEALLNIAFIPQQPWRRVLVPFTDRGN